MRYTAFGRQSLVAAALVATILIPAGAFAAGTSNDMVHGGCTTKADCANAIENSDIASTYSHLGVTPAGVNSTNTKMGVVTKDGRVLVDGQVVATNAYSYGREFIAGSTKAGEVYKRPTSVSFQSDQLNAWVRVYKGQFKYAIITECGNVVTATPVAPKATVRQVQPAPAPAPQPATPAPVINVTQTQTQTQTQTAPAPVQQVLPAPVSQPAQLPQTGSTLTAGLLGATAVFVTSWYYIRSRRGLLAAAFQR